MAPTPGIDHAPDTSALAHRNLQYFMTTKLLNRRQARWSEFASRFNFAILFWPGKQEGKPHTLTRISEDLPKDEDERIVHQSHVVLKWENLDSKLRLLSNSSSNEPAEGVTLFEIRWTKGYKTDKFPQEALTMLEDGTTTTKKISLAKCTNDQGQLRFRNALYIPNYPPLKLEILRLHHDLPSTEHPNQAKTF